MAAAEPSHATQTWRVWTTDASLTLRDPDAMPAARAVADRVTDAVDRACSSFRSDSELSEAAAGQADGVRISPLLEDLLRAALDVAELTDGAVDPTLGAQLEALGYLGSFEGTSVAFTTMEPAWPQVSVTDGILTAPAQVRFDLGATAKAFAADLIVATVHQEVSSHGVLVSLGGDIATAGPAPVGGWRLLVQDLDGDPAAEVSLAAGMAVATSSTQKRQWDHRGVRRHHILDPMFGLSADPVWRTSSCAAATCLIANAYSTAAIVKGLDATPWLESHHVAARLVDERGHIIRTNSWPAGSELLHGTPAGEVPR